MEHYFGDSISNIDTEISEGIGKTMVIDRLASDLDTIKHLSRFVTYVKIGWGLSFLLSEKALNNRISRIKDMGIGVSNGGTFLETCYVKGKFEDGLTLLKNSGFTHIEISEGVCNIPKKERKKAAEFARENNLFLIMEVGKKRKSEQLDLNETIDKVQEAEEFEPDLIIIEGRETGKDVEIYDSSGDIKWEWADTIGKTISFNKLMFEAPLEKQQVELILRYGNKVNLGNISMESIGALATQRFGLRGDTFSVERQSDKFEGSPATKFVLHIIKNSVKIDQATLVRITGMSRRTVQNALMELLRGNLIQEGNDMRDLRRKVYSII
ncbi:MAG: phosphosulfolactate synthase [Thermoplasmataceae archaeon]